MMGGEPIKEDQLWCVLCQDFVERPHSHPGPRHAQPVDDEEGLTIEEQRAAERELLVNYPEIAAGFPKLGGDGGPVGDAVYRPSHYARYKIEPIYFIMENELPFPEGNVVKYVVRWRHKNGVEDLKKARRMIDMMIKKAEDDPNYAK